jgi:hypothetical protein
MLQNSNHKSPLALASQIMYTQTSYINEIAQANFLPAVVPSKKCFVQPSYIQIIQL